MNSKTEFCRMQILVIAATLLEIKAFTEISPQTDILISGVGVPSSLYHLQEKLQQKPYDLVIQAGISGCFHEQYNGGSVVIAASDCFGDLGMEEKDVFTPIGDSVFSTPDLYPSPKGIIINNHPLLQSLAYPLVKAVTVNKVTDDPNQSALLQKTFSADIESMEGAALHYCCWKKNIPYLQLRAISNKVGDRNKKNWHIQLAVENLNKALLDIIKQFNPAH
ncbi:MAG: futalosine hydrolase [Ferruginibacter sp.]